tara:strand:- start:404 stop:970 length:567 start_codon:yes stop_codon:yes gene_type:complete
MRYVISIDVGIKNLGLCVFDFATAKFVFWDNVSLVPNGRYLPANNVQYVRAFVAQYEAFFNEAAVVLVERQMRCNMRIVEAVIQTLYFDKCVVINARSVKAHYNLGTKNYRLNKQRAVEWADMFLANNADAFAPGVANPFTLRHKKDDLADSLLLITYYLDTYSNQLTSASVEDLFTIYGGDGAVQGG